MNYFFIILGTFLTTILFGQTSQIKVRKPFDKMTYATVGGVYDGNITIPEIIAADKITILNNVSKLKIISYNVILHKGLYLDILVKNDSFSADLKDALNINPPKKGSLMWFTEIKAITEANDTIHLNPIVLKIR